MTIKLNAASCSKLSQSFTLSPPAPGPHPQCPPASHGQPAISKIIKREYKSKSITLTTPVTPLAREFCIFMASTTAHSWPSPTLSPTLTDTIFTTPGRGRG